MKAIKLVNRMAVPTLDLNATTKPYEIIHFVQELDKYRTCGRAFHEQLLLKALQGELGLAWCRSSRYDYEVIRKNLWDRLEKSQAWIELKIQVESGGALSDDPEMHMARFKDVVYARGQNL